MGKVTFLGIIPFGMRNLLHPVVAKSGYNTSNKLERKESARFHAFPYDKLMERDKVNLDIFWLRDESLEDSDNLPDPDVIALEIAENLEDALEQFSGIVGSLKE